MLRGGCDGGMRVILASVRSNQFKMFRSWMQIDETPDDERC